MAQAVQNRIIDLESVLRTTQDHSITQLQDIAQELDIWHQKVFKTTCNRSVLYCTGDKSKSYISHNEHV